jgi:isopenicillin-N N-acyltransferase like protein
MNLINLSGDHYTMGWQHGEQVSHLRPTLENAIEQRLLLLAQHRNESEAKMESLSLLWQKSARTTCDMLRGITDSLGLHWETVYRYTLASYLIDHSIQGIGEEGCTVWAAAAPITKSGQPMLVKNRDYRPWHLPIQFLARAKPAGGYAYAYVTSAGSPGVFSSGMNEKGLAVGDTHVTSRAIGSGLSRYSVMMEILERHHSVTSALEFLRQVFHIGDGTITLVDAKGDLAVLEITHTRQVIRRSTHGFLVSTNHYASQELHHQWLDLYPEELRGNSQLRYNKIHNALQAAAGEVDITWAQRLMSSHGNILESICRHQEADPRSTTISSVIYLPRMGRILVADGLPCQSRFQTLNLL